MNFKEGDEVVVVSTSFSFSRNHDNMIGQRGIVRRVDGTTIYLKDNNKLSDYYWNYNDLELASTYSLSPHDKVIKKIKDIKQRREALGYVF